MPEALAPEAGIGFLPERVGGIDLADVALEATAVIAHAQGLTLVGLEQEGAVLGVHHDVLGLQRSAGEGQETESCE